MLTLMLLATMLRSEPQMSEPCEQMVKYFKTFTGYNIPFKLIEPISKEEAQKSSASYYVGYFGDHDKLIKVVKKHLDKTIFTQEYEYHHNGKIKKVRVVNADGVVSINEYNEHGKPSSKK